MERALSQGLENEKVEGALLQFGRGHDGSNA